MKEKSEVNQIFQSFYSYVKNQFHTFIQILRSDNAKEYLSSSMKEFLTKQDIHHQTSCVYTPQQNGVAERKNRHLLEVTRAIMIERNVPKIFWGDAILTVAYLINRMPSKVLNFSTPIQKLLETYPNSPLIHTLPPKTFGCVVFVHKQAEGKLDPRAEKCIFVGCAFLKEYSSTWISLQVPKYSHNCIHMLLLWLVHELAYHSYCKTDIWTCMSQVYQFPNKSPISLSVSRNSLFLYF